MLSRKRLNFTILAVCFICAWYILSAPLLTFQDPSQDSVGIDPPLEHEDEEEAHIQPDSESKEPPNFSKQEASPPQPPPDRVVVIAKLPEDDISWVSSDLPDWQSAIYAIDTETPHNVSTLDPVSNSTLRTLRNKGMEANAYLAYIVQNYDALPSTIAFVHPHKDGYPEAWHTDNSAYSNVVSLQTLNTDFVQRNGYANLRCNPNPGCPHEVMPFRDPPEAHRTIEAAMPDAWRDLFNNTDVPHILATPCCAQFAVSSEQVQKRPLEEYRKYYRWLMETDLKDETSGRVFEYLWHVIFGRESVYCPEVQQCYCNVYNQC